MSLAVTKPRTRIQEIFAQIAKMCAEKVRNLPKGERRKAYLECIRENMIKYGKNPTGPG